MTLFGFHRLPFCENNSIINRYFVGILFRTYTAYAVLRGTLRAAQQGVIIMVDALPAHISRQIDEILAIRLEDPVQEGVLCRALLQVSRAEGHSYGAAFAYAYLADSAIALGDYPPCPGYLREAQELAERFGYRELLINIYHFWGMFYTTAFDGQSALGYYYKELKLADEFGDLRTKSAVYNNIGNIFLNQAAYSDATEYFEKACTVLGDQGYGVFARDLCIALTNLCCLALETHNPDKGEEYLARCEKIPSGARLNGSDYLIRFGRAILAGYRPGDGYMDRVDRLLDREGEISDRSLVYDASINLCQMLLFRGDQPRLERTLRLMESIGHEGSVKRTMEIRDLWVQYCERFHMESGLQAAYREFYRATKETESAARLDKADGFRAKLSLLQAIDEQTSMQEENDSLAYLAVTDELTGLLNRRYLNKLAGQTLRDASVERLGAVMVDIDYFKEYNDTYGHQAGDAVLRAVAGCLIAPTERIRPCRFGGDEFLCLCVDCTDGEILSYAADVQSALEALNIEHHGSQVSPRLTLSIGCTNMRKSTGFDLDHLFRLADAALYQAKQRGRNTCCSEL